MAPSRPLLCVALTGLLAVSCSTAVVPAAPVGGPILLAPAPHLVPAAAVPTDDPIATDYAPREPISPLPSAEVEAPVSFDVAPRQPLPALPADPPAPAPPATKAMVGPLQFISQTLNNCGPASVAEVLNFWGLNRGQAEVQSVLRGDGNPYGMTPAGVPSYANSLGLDVVLGTAGTPDLMKALLRAGFPVIVNQTVSATDKEFHYRPIDGFDDERGAFVSSDPLIGPDYAIPYADFDQVWAYTGQRFMVIYPPDKKDQLDAALAEGGWDPAHAEGGGAAVPWAIPNGGGPAPVTTPAVNGKAPSGPWYNGPVSVTFGASDGSGFGVAATSYSLDKQRVQLYRGPIVVKDAGKHTLTFHSVNFNGSQEADKTLEVDIDTAPPTTTASFSGAKQPNGAYRADAHPVQVALASDDADGSGVAVISYSLDGAPAQPYNAPLDLAVGPHTLTFASVDAAGNAEVQKAAAVTVEAAPASPPPSASPKPSASPLASAQASATASSSPSATPSHGLNVCPLYDPFQAQKQGPLAIKLRICDSTGKNVSAPTMSLAVQSILGPPNGFKPSLPGPFRYDAASAGYESDLNTSGWAAGTYMVNVAVSGDPASHAIQFVLR